MKESAYKKAGVDIDEAAALIERIKPHVKTTHRSGVMGGLGGFGALFDMKQTGLKDPVLVSSTDGVGTKIKIAIDTDTHDTIGIDAVAMCVNDVIVQGAEPLFFLDYFATGKLENRVAEQVIAGIAEGCRQAGCALIGGETAEMPGLYAPGDYDIAGFTVGAAERSDLITGEHIAAGDVILGLASSGVHSNGFSLVRKIAAASGIKMTDAAPFAPAQTLKDALLTPTRIYVKPLLSALKIRTESGAAAIKGMAHITGGGLYENVPRILPQGLTAYIDAKAWALPPVFRWLAEAGQVESRDMARTLNCGIGMVVVCAPERADAVATHLKTEGETVFTLGHIKPTGADNESVVMADIDTAWAKA